MQAKQLVNIDFRKVGKTFREFVRAKAIAAGSTIVYECNGQCVEEDPKTGMIIILRQSRGK
jgi:hypothetical protein